MIPPLASHRGCGAVTVQCTAQYCGAGTVQCCAVQLLCSAVLPPLHRTDWHLKGRRDCTADCTLPAHVLHCTAFLCTAPLHCTALNCTALHHSTALHCSIQDSSGLYCKQVYKSISLTKVDTSVDGKYGTFCLVYKFHCNLCDPVLDNSD